MRISDWSSDVCSSDLAWVAATHGIQPSSALFHAIVEKRHLATPDGVTVDAAGRVVLAEIKTTNKTWRSIPRTYLRQVWRSEERRGGKECVRSCKSRWVPDH